MSEGIFAPARSSNGTLAHAIYVRDLDVFERKTSVVVVCLRAEANLLLGEEFDLDAQKHEGYRTCEKCVEGVRRHIATMKMLRE